MPTSRIVFEVEGRPVPQGSMTASYNRTLGVAHVHHVQGEALAQWRASIRIAAREAGATVSPLPIAISVVFGMPRPKAHMRWSGGRLIPKIDYWYARPGVAPDVDKLLRAVLDALTGVCYADDAQVVEVYCSKVYADVTKIGVMPLDAATQQTLSAWVGADKEADTGAGQVLVPNLFQEEG